MRSIIFCRSNDEFTSAAQYPKNILNQALNHVRIDKNKYNYASFGSKFESEDVDIMEEYLNNQQNNNANNQNDKSEKQAKILKLREIKVLANQKLLQLLVHNDAANSADWINFLVNVMKANVNNQNIKERTALLVACQNNNFEAAQALLDCEKIQVNLKDAQLHTPLYWAVKNNNFKLINLLTSKDAKLESEYEYKDEEFNKKAKKGWFSGWL